MKSLTSLTSKIKRNKFTFFSWFLFLVTRLLILKLPPLYYSDVSHDYERYANMWWYGLTPYLEHYYEYPPATIPLLLAPLWLDQKGLGFYYQNYRTIIFGLEFFLFSLIVKTLKNRSLKAKYLSIIFYCLIGLVAKDFWYEGLGLVFIGSYLAAILFLLKGKDIKNSITTWFFFWLSFGIKFMTLPLFPALFASIKNKFRNKLLPIIIGGVIVWGVPIIIFRSSLLVSVVFHLNRPAKYGSFPSHLADFANHFTQSETRTTKPPDYQLEGPISAQLENIFGPVFYIGIVVIALISFIHITKRKNPDLKSLLKYSLIYILFIFLSGKTFSSPFYIWLIPLLAIFPFKTTKNQSLVFLLTLYMIILDTTSLISLPPTPVLGPVTLKLLRDSTRFIPMFILLAFFSTIKDKK